MTTIEESSVCRSFWSLQSRLEWSNFMNQVWNIYSAFFRDEVHYRGASVPMVTESCPKNENMQNSYQHWWVDSRKLALTSWTVSQQPGSTKVNEDANTTNLKQNRQKQKIGPLYGAHRICVNDSAMKSTCTINLKLHQLFGWNPLQTAWRLWAQTVVSLRETTLWGGWLQLSAVSPLYQVSF